MIRACLGTPIPRRNARFFDRSASPDRPLPGRCGRDRYFLLSLAYFVFFTPLPGGRPRRRGPATLIWLSHAGGRPRRLPRPASNRSKLRMAISIWSRSPLSSSRILVISM